VLGDDPILPSVVHYGDGGIVVRQSEGRRAPHATLASVKRVDRPRHA
jgi:hypothetical protein